MSDNDQGNELVSRLSECVVIYLYVKRHSISGLKYFGRTISDPNKYLGSGVYWGNHIAKHGVAYVVTDQIFEFETQELCTKFAIKFSSENNIVESDAWANLIVETGLPGNGVEGLKHSSETRKRISEAVRAAITPEMRERMSVAKRGKPHSVEHDRKISIANRGRVITEPWRKKLSKSRIGMKFSEEHRLNMSKARTAFLLKQERL